METVADATCRAVARHPVPALSSAELHELVRRETGGPIPGPELLVQRIRHQPERFRVLDPWRGPWRPLRSGSRLRPVPACPLAGAGIGSGWWVVPGGEGSAEAEPDRLCRTLRQTLASLGRGVDGESVTALTRWVGMVLEARATRAWLHQAGSGVH